MYCSAASKVEAKRQPIKSELGFYFIRTRILLNILTFESHFLSQELS